MSTEEKTEREKLELRYSTECLSGTLRDYIYTLSAGDPETYGHIARVTVSAYEEGYEAHRIGGKEPPFSDR